MTFILRTGICFNISMQYLQLHEKLQAKWIYDMDPFEPLKYEQPLQQLKSRIAEEGSKAVFSPLIEKFILKNTHRVTVEMQVSRGLLTSDS